MPRYALFREYPPALTRTELDGMVLASGAALQSYIYRGKEHPATAPHGISWVRSYWQQGGTWGMCVFEAPNLGVLSAFQELCATPFTDAMEVEETAANPEVATPVAVRLPLMSESSDPVSSAESAAGLPRLDVGRVYWNAERKTAIALVAHEPATKGALEVAAGLVEVRPEEYA